MNNQKLEEAIAIHEKIRETRLRLDFCRQFERGCLASAKFINNHPDAHTPIDTIKVSIEYSDGHFGNTLKLTVPQAHVVLSMCVKQLTEELKAYEKQFYDM